MSNNRLYLLTGAAGFLGSNVCRQLVDRGEKVRAFVLPNDPAAKFVPKEVEIVEGDLCNQEDVDHFFDVTPGIKTICIHCASMVTINPDFNQKLLDVNVGGTEHIIESCLSHEDSFEKLVYVSSTGAIPEAPEGLFIKEVNYFDPDKVVGWYSRSKAMATQKVLDSVKRDNLNACVVHPSGILGPNDFSMSETTSTLVKICNGEMPVGISGSFNLCDVRDLAYGCIAAADKGRKGECYILGNKEVTMKEMAEMLQKDVHCKGVKFFLPVVFADFIAGHMEKKAARNHTKPLMTKFAVYNLKRNNRFDYSKAKNELGYKTRPYAETLHDEAVWMKEQGLIKSAS